MQEINAWLQSEDFNEGVCLYEKYGTNTFFIKILHTDGPTQYNIDKLGAELKALAPAPPAITHDAPKIEIDESPLSQPEAGQSEETPTSPGEPSERKHNSKAFHQSLALKEQVKIYYRQLERNMTELDLSEKESLCFIIAKQIITLDEKIKATWALLDYYDEHGCFPNSEPKEEIVRTPEQEIQLLRQSTSKAKTRLKSGNCRDVMATQELIANNNKRIIALGGKVK